MAKKADIDCRNHGQKPWSFRRRLFVGTICFCFAAIAVCVLNTSILESVANNVVSSAFLLVGAIITVYTGGAVSEDIFKKDE